MAVIDTPEQTVEVVEATSASDGPEGGGFADVLSSGDHKVVGRLYIASSLVLAAVMAILAIVFGVERLSPDSLDVFGEEGVLAFWALGRYGAVLLAAMPLVIGVAMVVTPLQIGARAIAFPRAAAASFWGWAGGSLLFLLAAVVDGGPGGSSDIGVRLYVSSLVLVMLAILLAAITIATTVITHRQEGMTTETIPMFTASMLIASVLWILTLPVAIAQLGLAYVDIRHAGGAHIGGGSALFDITNWLLQNPAIYVIAIPVLGFAADAIPSAAGRRINPRNAASASIVIFAVLGVGTFLADAGEGDHRAWLLIGMGVLAVLPVLSIIGLVADMIIRGGLKVNAGALYGAAALMILALTTLLGAASSIPRLELHGTVAGLGITNGAVIALLLAGLGGIHWWSTKIGRQPATDGLGHIAPLVLFIGGLVSVVAEAISGFAGHDLELSPSWAGGVESLNILVLIGAVLVLAGLVLAIVSFRPLTKVPESEVDANPWNGLTLEWLAPSPPPLHNFDEELPVVTSAEPLIDDSEEK